MTLAGYVVSDLLRNPRRTLASLVGVVVGVGLFSAVLFFIDGSGASMTRRAVQPLTLDMQRVLTAPLGGGIRFERSVGDRALKTGGETRVILTVTNDGRAPAHEVVVRDRPSAPLAYVPGSTTLDRRAIEDVGSGIPLSQGGAGTGLNIGTVSAAASHRITYRLKAERSVSSTAGLPARATISTREALTPTRANTPRPASLPALAEKVASIPGVKAADPLVFVDMATGSISARGAGVPGPVKLFAFDAQYQSHYPSIKVLSGRIQPGGALISAETARELKLAEGDPVTLELPGSARPLTLKVSGITDVSGANPLFESRKSSNLESFEYVPYTIVVGPDLYRTEVAPAFAKAAAARNSTVKSLPLEELDLLLDRSGLNSDPATAVAQTRKTATAVLGVAPNQDYLIDNISNTLQVANGDARIAKRMFVFLGLPGAILAAILTAYAGTLLAEAQRRESALLRVRGASRRHLLYLLALRTVAIAGLGALLGTALGFAAVLALACFATVYDKAKLADARFLVGSDIRLTPNPTSGAKHPTAQASKFRVAGATGATPVVFSPENAVLTSDFNEDVATLAAIDPPAFAHVAALQDSLFARRPASQMMTALRTHPDGILVNAALAKGLKLKTGDRARVLLARGTDQQTRKPAKVLGLFTQFPGAPKGTDVVANLGFYERETGLTEADYYLVSTADRSASGVNRAVQSLSAPPHFTRRFDVQTSGTALDKEQSSLTALNVRGLLQLDSFFTFLMAATATAMFVFGLLMQRRREYVTLRAQGFQSREIRWLVLAESGISATLGAAIGVLVGIGMASQFVHVLRPIFTLPPPLEVPAFELAVLAALVLGATVLSSAAAALLIGRLKPAELLRDE